MLANIINNFSILIITVRRNTWYAVMTTLMLLALVFAYSMRDTIPVLITTNPRSDYSEKIQVLLDANRKILSADRVYIKQFHTIDEVPYVTITYMSVSSGITKGVDWDQPMSETQIAETKFRVFPTNGVPTCVEMDFSEIRDPTYKKSLENNGVKIFYACPILDIANQPTGIIYASYISKYNPHPTKDEIFVALSKTSEKVSGYLREVDTAW